MTTPVTFLGAGAMGQGIAALLVRSGPTALLARPATAAVLRAAGRLVVRVPEGEVEVEIGDGDGRLRVIADPAEIDPASAVVFTPKGHNLADSVEQVRAGWAPTTGFVLGLQNGMQRDRLFADAFGAERVLGAATLLGARRDPDDVVRVTSVSQTYFGEHDRSASERLTSLAARFNDAGVSSRADVDITRLQWSKCANSLGIFGVTCLTQLPTNVIMRNEALVEVFLGLLTEGAQVAAAEGHPVDDFPDLPLATWLATPRGELVTQIASGARSNELTAFAYSSMSMDIIYGRPTEVDMVFGDVITRAAQHGIDVPLLRMAYGLIAGADQVRDVVPHRPL